MYELLLILCFCSSTWMEQPSALMPPATADGSDDAMQNGATAADESVQAEGMHTDASALTDGMQADGEAPDTSKPTTRNPPGSNPFKKRKVALFLAYVGHGYNGMQRNPGVRTIEEDLFKAIAAAGGISESNADEQGFIKVQLPAWLTGWVCAGGEAQRCTRGRGKGLPSRSLKDRRGCSALALPASVPCRTVPALALPSSGRQPPQTLPSLLQPPPHTLLPDPCMTPGLLRRPLGAPSRSTGCVPPARTRA